MSKSSSFIKSTGVVLHTNKSPHLVNFFIVPSSLHYLMYFNAEKLKKATLDGKKIRDRVRRRRRWKAGRKSKRNGSWKGKIWNFHFPTYS
jgi:hypothetical protein